MGSKKHNTENTNPSLVSNIEEKSTVRNTWKDILRQDGVYLGILLLLGLALRVWYLSQVVQAPDFEALRQDLDVQNYYARALVTGDWEVRPGVTDPEMRTTPYYRPPGYPYLLAVIYTLTGGSYLAPRLFNIALGLVAILALYFLGRTLFHRRIGLIAAFLAATYWNFLYVEGEVNDPAIFVCMVPLLLLLLRWWALKRSWKRAACIGLVVGAYALMRPNILLFGPVMAAWMLYMCMRREGWRKAMPSWIALATATFLVIAPVTLRNYRVSGEFVPISTYFGENFLIGNGPEADGVSPWLPYLQELEGTGHFSVWVYGNMVRGLGKEVGNPDLTHSEASSIFFRKGLDYIAEHKMRTLKLAIKKALMFWAPVEITGNKVIQYEKDFYPPLKYLPGFPFVMMLWLGGILFFLRDLGRRSVLDAHRTGDVTSLQLAFLLFAFILVYYASFIPFFVNSRARTPIIGLCLVVGAYGLHHLWSMWKEKRRKPLLIWTVVYVAFYLLSSICWYPYTPDKARWYYGRADSWLRVGEADKAWAEIEKMLDLTDTSPYMPYRLGQAFAKLDMPERAMRLFHAAVMPGSQEQDARYHLAAAMVENGMIEEGMAEYREALRLNPDDARAHNNLGLLLQERGETKAALHHFQEAVRVAPDFALAHSNLGHLFGELGYCDDAIHHFEQAVTSEPEQQDYYYNLARQLANCGRTQEAMQRYEQALTHNSEDVRSLNNLGLLQAAAGEYQLAQQQYETAIRIKPDFSLPYANLGELFAGQGQWERAVQIYEDGLTKQPEDPGLLNGLGYLYQQQGEFSKALAYYERALKEAPEFSLVYNNIGNIHLAQQAFPEAQKSYLQALEVNPHDEYAYFNLAELAVKEDRIQDAISYYKKALQNAPRNADIPNNLANLLARNGALDEAIQYYQLALRINPGYINAHYNLGSIYASLGQNQLAQGQFKAVLQLQPQHEAAQKRLQQLSGYAPNAFP